MNIKNPKKKNREVVNYNSFPNSICTERLCGIFNWYVAPSPSEEIQVNQP